MIGLLNSITKLKKKRIESRFRLALEKWGLRQDVCSASRFTQRTFFYGKIPCDVECVECFAVPGTAEVVLTLLSELPKGRLLNLGGGIHTAPIYERLGHVVTNVDLEKPRNKSDVQFNLNSYEELPTQQNSFEIVVAQEIVEHVENPWELFRRAYKALLPGGYLIITTPNILSELSIRKIKSDGHFHWFSPDCFGYHINPLPYFEIELIASRTGFRQSSFLGNNHFFEPNQDHRTIIRKSECLIWLFKKEVV
jgi:2-polyprenyl-3-methyl-5-hydroxy-6-metoxy-1,4-benzoquinol methylase